MTPLAKLLAEQFALPPKRREVDDPRGMLRLVPKAHCFELSAVLDLSDGLAASILEHETPQTRLAFLPAPVTVLEWCDEGFETGFLMVQSADEASAVVYDITGGDAFNWMGSLPLRSDAEVGGLTEIPNDLREKLVSASSNEEWHALAAETTGLPSQAIQSSRLKARLYAMLALINTPRVIGRRQHMSEAGLQKRIAFASGMKAGKFPLRAWTEIKLEIAPPKDASDDAPRETHLTGGKALHFCRAHLRIQNGMVVLVRAHWRGDPALGIKQTRYRVVPPAT